MSKGSGRTRDYDASRRRQRAQESRDVILDAARALFARRGYHRTTVGSIADEAGVSKEAVAKKVGAKSGVVSAVVERSVGVARDVDYYLATELAAIDDAAKVCEAFGQHLATTGPRRGPLLAALRSAAEEDEDGDAAGDWRERERLRREYMAPLAAHLAVTGGLRDGLSIRGGADLLWVYGSVEVWDLLVNRRGWSVERYGRWVSDQLVAALL